MPKHADGPPCGSQPYFWRPEAFQGAAYPNPSPRYEDTHGDTAERPFPLPGRVERKKRKRRPRR